MIKVKWTETKIPNQIEMDWYPDADWSEMDKHYEGEIISSHNSFWNGTQLVVACTDKQIRTVSESKVTII